MNQVLAATIIITAVIGMGTYVGSTILETSTTSTVSSSIDQQKKQEEIHAVYDGTRITLENRGKDTSHIVKYRFYDDTGSLVHEIQSDELQDGTLVSDDRTLDRRIPSINRYWPSNATSGEIITSFGNVIPISVDISDPNNIQTNLDNSNNPNPNNPVGVGASTLNGLGVSMSIVNYDITGRLFAGDTTLLGDQYNLIPYRTVDSSTTWVSAVRDNDKSISHEISLDGSSYTYNTASETFRKTYRSDDWTSGVFVTASSNALTGTAKPVYYSATSVFPEWIKYKSSSEGMSIIKLSDDTRYTDMIFHTFLEPGMTIQIVNSIHPNLHTKQYNNDGSFVMFTGTSTNQNDPKTVKRYTDRRDYGEWTCYGGLLHEPGRGCYYNIHYFGNLPAIPVGITLNDYRVDYTRDIHVSYNGPHMSGRDLANAGFGCVRYQCTEAKRDQFPYYNFYQTSGALTVSDMVPLSVSKTTNSDSTTIHSVHQSCAQRVHVPNSYYNYLKVYCVPTSVNVSILELDPFNIITTHNNTRTCLESDIIYWGGFGSYTQCIRYSAQNATHTQSNVHLPATGTNYIIIKYDGTPSISNTLLDEDHVFSYMNKFYRDNHNTHKGLSDSISEANIFLLPQNKDKPLLSIHGLPSNIPYEITAGDHTMVNGITTQDGKITLHKDDDIYLPGNGNTSPRVLTIYPESTTHTGIIKSSIILDGFNRDTIQFDWRRDTVYVPQNYIRMVFLKQVEMYNVQVDDVSFPYLNRIYTPNSAIHIPVIPSADIIRMTINGEPIEISHRYVDTGSRIKAIPHTVDNNLATAYGRPAESLSEIVSNTFFTATHNGTLTAVLDLSIAGSVSSSYSTEYTGEKNVMQLCTRGLLQTGKWTATGSCWTVFGATWTDKPQTYTNLYKSSTRGSYTGGEIINPVFDQIIYTDSVKNAINSGALGQLAVEVTVFKDMVPFSTDIVYVATSADATSKVEVSDNIHQALVADAATLNYPLQPVKTVLEIPVTTGEMIEVIISVHLHGVGIPVPQPNVLSLVLEVPPTKCASFGRTHCIGPQVSQVASYKVGLAQTTTNVEIRGGLITLVAS